MFLTIGTKLTAKTDSPVLDIKKGTEYEILEVMNTFLRTKCVRVKDDGHWVSVQFFELPEVEQMEEQDEEAILQDKIDKQKSIADKILKSLSKINPTVIVAGGAPRDWYLGKEADDIDVYIHYDIAPPVHIARHLKEDIGFEVEVLGELDEAKQTEYEKLPSLLRVFQGYVDEQRVQVMVLSEPTYNIVQQFPVSSSKVWYCTERGVVPEREFQKEFIEERIQLVKEEYWEEYRGNVPKHQLGNKGNKGNYIRKIMAKFPDCFYVNEKDYIKYRDVKMKLEAKRKNNELQRFNRPVFDQPVLHDILRDLNNGPLLGERGERGHRGVDGGNGWVPMPNWNPNGAQIDLGDLL